MNQLAGALSSSNEDFNGTPTEHYDVFYSDAGGVPDPNGDFVSVERTFDQASGGGWVAVRRVAGRASRGPSGRASGVRRSDRGPAVAESRNPL